MDKQTLGIMIATNRKEKGMTQSDVAKEMGVTDKAVSKWERDLSCPDVNSLAKLAEIFGIPVEELLQVEVKQKENVKNKTGFSKRYAYLTLAILFGIVFIFFLIMVRNMSKIMLITAFPFLFVAVFMFMCYTSCTKDKMC